MEHVIFCVGDRPQVYWDWDLSRKNLEFLCGVDATYYNHVVQAHVPHLEGESKLYAAAALRIAYAQGLETLFALLCAAMQAPTCVVGWMQSYRNDELRSTASGVSSGPRPRVVPAFRPARWSTMAKCVHSYLPIDETKKAWVQDGFGSLWSRFAKDFLDERSLQEYHALKHGSRPRLGGFRLAAGLQPDRGTPASPESMQSLGGSEFGSTFFVEERIGNNKLHCRPRNVSMNWIPENIVHGIELVAMSIQNVVGFLKIINGTPPAECKFHYPLEQDGFDRPWAKGCGVMSFNMDTRISVEDISMWTKDEVALAIQQSMC